MKTTDSQSRCLRPFLSRYMAHYFAGCCLLYGEGLEKNPDEAIRHLKVAVDAEYGGYSALLLYIL